MTATWKIILGIWNTISPCNFQNKKYFPALSDTIISQLKWKIISLVWIFPEQFITRTVLFLKIQSAKSKLPCLFASTIEMVATSSEHFSANCYELFHSGELVLKLVLKDDGQYWFGFQVGYQPQRISFSHQNCLPTIGFQKLRQPPLCLFWVVNRSLPCVFLLSGARLLSFSIQI